MGIPYVILRSVVSLAIVYQFTKDRRIMQIKELPEKYNQLAPDKSRFTLALL
jgi:hypothetical protein